MPIRLSPHIESVLSHDSGLRSDNENCRKFGLGGTVRVELTTYRFSVYRSYRTELHPHIKPVLSHGLGQK